MLRTVAALLVFVCTRAVAAPIERVVVLSTRGSATHAFVVEIERAGKTISASAPKPFGIAPAAQHAERATLHGALAGDDLVFVADDAVGPFASSLWRMSRTDTVRVVDSVATLSRPLVAGRRVYVTRGHEAENLGEANEFVLDVTELDLDGGTTVSVAHLVGQSVRALGVDDQLGLLVLAVTPHAPRGDLLAFDLHNGVPPRDLGTLGPVSQPSFVATFHTAEHSLGPAILYDQLDGQAHVVAALELDGKRTELARDTSRAAAPRIVGGALVPVERSPRGVLVPRAIARDGARLYERALAGSAAFVVRVPDGAEADIVVPSGERWEPVGFLP